MGDTSTALQPKIAQRKDGETIAYHRTPGKSPGIIFLTGYMSDMTGTKAIRLEEFCRARGLAYLRFDYFGHGASSGAFTDGTIGRWADDATFAMDTLTDGPQILVGSSLGGWIMLLAALRRPERIAAILGIASAPDFTEDLITNMLTDEQKATMERDGVVPVYSPYDPEPTPVTKLIIDEGRNHLVLRDEIPLDCPVRLIHGMKDPDVPWQTSVRLAEKLRSKDVEMTLVKESEHRMSEPEDLDRLCETLDGLLRGLQASAYPVLQLMLWIPLGASAGNGTDGIKDFAYVVDKIVLQDPNAQVSGINEFLSYSGVNTIVVSSDVPDVTGTVTVYVVTLTRDDFEIVSDAMPLL